MTVYLHTTQSIFVDSVVIVYCAELYLLPPQKGCYLVQHKKQKLLLIDLLSHLRCIITI